MDQYITYEIPYENIQKNNTQLHRSRTYGSYTIDMSRNKPSHRSGAGYARDQTTTTTTTRDADATTMPCPKGTRTKGLTRKYAHSARVQAVHKRARTETYLKKRAFIDAKLAAHAAAKARAGAEEDSRSALERVPEVRGVMPEREIERRVTLDVEAYRAAAKRASERAGGASTSGGTIGKVAFDGRSDVGIAGKRRREVGEDVGEKPERIGAAARKKKKKNKKLNARRARQC